MKILIEMTTTIRTMIVILVNTITYHRGSLVTSSCGEDCLTHLTLNKTPIAVNFMIYTMPCDNNYKYMVVMRLHCPEGSTVQIK